MTDDQRSCHILVTAVSRIASVELCAILPLRELVRQGRCQFVYADEARVSASHLSWADVVFFVRPCSRRGQGLAQAASGAGRKLICYYDDDLLDLPKGTPSQAYYASSAFRRTLLWFLERADVLCFCNADLAQAYGRLTSRPTVVVPYGIECPPVADRPWDGIRILFAGSVDHAAFVDEFCGPALRVAAEQPQTEIYFIGARPRLVAELPIRYIPYVENYADYRSLVAALAPDIGLAPLPAGSFFSRKFYAKLLDYGSLGAAVIYSNVPPYQDVVEDGETGLLVENTPAAWQQALVRLIGDAPLRRHIGQATLNHIRSDHSLSRIAGGYAGGLAPFLAYRAQSVPESACPVPEPNILREYIADHGLLRALRMALGKVIGI